MCDSDRWPIPPYHPEDYWALRELLGPEESERGGHGVGVPWSPNTDVPLEAYDAPKGLWSSSRPRPIFRLTGASLRGPSRNVCTSYAATGLTLRLSQSLHSGGSRYAASGSGWGDEREWELAG